MNELNLISIYMDNPINQEDIITNPEVIPEEIKPKKSKTKTLLLILISLVLICLAVVVYLYIKDGKDPLNLYDNKVANEDTPNPSEEQENDIIDSQPEPVGQATITGTLSFPSEIMPSLKVCAVNTEDKKETCVQTEEGDNDYTLSVAPGTYLIYSADTLVNNSKAYYTACDTYEDGQTDPRCNSNYNDSNGQWNHEDFVCYEDTACKAAFTPLPVTLVDKQTVELETIVQGWYIPCSHDMDVCNDPNFDVWSDYIE